MFPSTTDASEFKAYFGDEAHISRSPIERAQCSGTTVAATIQPEATPEATLELAWSVARSLARWLLDRAGSFPETERYMVIVGWSKATRPLQGQIFKAGGTAENLRQIAASPDWLVWEQTSGYTALLRNWQKDVFARPVG